MAVKKETKKKKKVIVQQQVVVKPSKDDDDNTNDTPIEDTDDNDIQEEYPDYSEGTTTVSRRIPKLQTGKTEKYQEVF